MLAKKLWVSENFDRGVSNVLLQGLEFSNGFSESPVFAFLHFYNDIILFNDFFLISAVFASQTFLVKVTRVNRQMMMMTRMMMKMRMMMKTKAGFFCFQNLLNAQSSLCRNGGHSVITQLVAFISNKMKLYLSFFNRRWEDGNYWSHWNKPCCFAKNNISHNSVQVLYVAKFNTHIENLDNNWQVIATMCTVSANSNGLLALLVNSILSSVVKNNKDFTHCLFQCT